MYDRCGEYIQYLNEGDWMAQRDDTSEFWAEIFRERKNYPEFNDIITMRRGATYPLADRGAESDPKIEFQHAQAAYFVMAQSVPEAYFQELNESAIGCPLSFDFNGQMLSAGGVVNALTAYRIIQWCKSTGLSTRPLRILEIGAGYGQLAYQLFQQLQIKSYTICDLPENLFLSAFFLQANFPSKVVVFVGKDDLAKDDLPELVFLAPPFLKTLAGSFDLVINSYSFQEMNRTSVVEYFAFVATTLVNDGLFYSLNAHRKSGVVWPSDYPVEKFHLASLMPVRKYPHHYVFATNPYELVMTKRTEAPPTNVALACFKHQLDAIGEGLQLGLHDELLEICQKFSQSQLDVSEVHWLEKLYDFLHVTNYAEKKEILERMRRSGDLPMVVAYLAGSLEFAYGYAKTAQVCLEDGIKGLSAAHAKVISYIMLACLAYRVGTRAAGDAFRSQAQRLVPHLAPEITRWAEDYNALTGQIAYQLHLDLPQRSVAQKGLFGQVRRKLFQIRDRVGR